MYRTILCLTTLLTLLGPALMAQDWLKEVPPGATNFYTIQQAFDRYYNNNFSARKGDSEWKRFKRWEHFMEPRVYPTGQFPAPSVIYDAARLQDRRAADKTALGNWNFIGPDNPGWGRVNCIEIDPSNANTFWVGTPGGGIWKSTDAGTSWTEMTGTLPTLSIANIVIDPANTNIIYVATGDHYGYVPAGWPWFAGGTYSMGILKSTDGGASWNPTGMAYQLADNLILRRLLLHPNNSQILLTGASDGIYRSTDAGVSWTKQKGGNIYDMEWHASDPNVVYAVSDSVFRSTDAGVTWSLLPAAPIFAQNTFYRRVSIEVTPANPDYIYVLRSESSAQGELHLSTNGGATFNQLTSPGFSFYGYWDNVLAVSPTDVNRIICGGPSIEHTTDGGASWSYLSTGYVDHHDAQFLPDGTTVLLGNDGGIFRSTGNSHTNLSYGLQLTQFYAIGGSATDPNIVFGGVQDRGTLRMVNGAWDRVLPNDGAESVVDYTNPDVVYSSWQYGNFQKSTDGGDTYTAINTGQGSWTAPMVMHPTNPNILFYGGNEVRKSIDGGLTWNDISSVVSGRVVSLAVSNSNPDYIYAATYYQVYKTTNGGTSWSNVTGSLPIPTNGISGLAINGSDPNDLWATLSGYVPGEKVYRTTNGGLTWTNISGSLPNVPVNCVEHDRTTVDNDVYIGTDMGVYFRDDGASDWTFFNNGLPKVIVHELEIHYGTSMLRAGTHGRGLWESPTQTTVSVPEPPAPVGSIAIYPSVTSGRVRVDVLPEGETEVEISVKNMLGQAVLMRKEWVNGARQIELDLGSEAAGIYIVNVAANFGKRSSKVILTK